MKRPDRRPPRPAQLAGHDAEALAAALVDVIPIAPPNRARLSRPAPAPVPMQLLADEAAALAASRLQGDAIAEAWDVGLDHEADQSFVRPGLNADVLRKLRRGGIAVQAELDLHSHSVEEAREALAVFLAECRAKGWRCVRVIHGKGHGSPNREPRLKGKVRRWLQQRDEVLAYCEPREHAGGSGAVLVLLRGRPR